MQMFINLITYKIILELRDAESTAYYWNEIDGWLHIRVVGDRDLRFFSEKVFAFLSIKFI